MLELPHVDDCVIAPATTEQFNYHRDILWPLWSQEKRRKESLALRKLETSEAYSHCHRRLSWVLVDRNNPTEAVSYLETLRRDAWSKDSEGKIENVTTYAIICVITQDKYRRRGYSHRLLRQLHYILAPPSHIGPWPSKWGPKPDLDKLREHLPPTELTHLSSVAPPGFYEAAFIGPDEDAREGWVSRPEENIMLNWDFSSSLCSTAGGSNTVNGAGRSGVEWDWTYVYSTDYDSITPALTQAHLRELQTTRVPIAGDKVFRIRPEPCIFRFLDLHMVFGLKNMTRGMTPADRPTGIRWIPRSAGVAPSSPGHRFPDFQSTDPLILFIDHGVAEGELVIQMALNISPEFAPRAVDALVHYCQSTNPPMTKLLAFCPPPAFRDEIVRRGGLVRDRKEVNFAPHGTCWYGPKGTKGWLAENEIWTWA